jgi:hypothetical protein
MNRKWGWNVQVEDLRNHGAEAVMTLRHLLMCGAKITPDPKRAGFYEVESESTVYYIYAPSTNGKVVLLATWPREGALATASVPSKDSTSYLHQLNPGPAFRARMNRC